MPIPHLAQKTRSNKSWQSPRGRKYRLPAKRQSYKKRLLKAVLVLGLAGAVVGSLALAGVIFYYSRNLPDPNRLLERQIAQSTKIYDRTGQTVLYEIAGDQKRTLVNIKEIPDYVKWATIAIEDKDFYKHHGFSILAILRTAVTNIIFHKKAGASTLTQQFIKNAVLSPEKTYSRKIKELILAYRLEKKFSKEEILQMYLNEIPYGSTAYGVEAASQRYFGKSVRDINLAEAAILAALPQAPTRYSPYGPHKDLLIARQHYILDLMVEQGYISPQAAEEAKKTELHFVKQANNIIAPHFVMYVKELLSEKYGEKFIEQGGLKIYTTLDLYKQKIAEEVVKQRAEKNQKKYDAWNAALVAIDPKTGQVLAMVGSKDYFGQSGPQGCTSGKDCKFEPNDNVALRPRQPGSSLKPIVYATSFLRGYTPTTILYDVVTNFSNTTKPYEPHNYDLVEHGPVSIRQALAGSLNIPAVKALYLAGVDNVLSLINDLGYTTLRDKDRYGLSLVLGGGEVKLLEHTNAYSAFARDGQLRPVSVILRVEDKEGNVLEEFSDNPREVLDSQVARQINDILSDNEARAYVFGQDNWLNLGKRPVAAKTGTTNDYRDAWTIGYTPSLVAGVWVGNNDNSAMKRGAAGGVVAAPIWHDFMKRVLGDTPIEYFKKPEEVKTGKPILDGEGYGEVTVKIDKASGLLATEYTPPDYIEEKIFAQHHCILYYVNKDDPRGDAPADPTADPQFENWEKAVQEWVEAKGLATSAPPTAYDNVHLPENRPTFLIENIVDGQTITDPLLSVKINASAPRGIHKVEYYLDNTLISEKEIYPFDCMRDISFLPNGFHKLKVRVCDDVDNCSEKELNINVHFTGNQAQNIDLKVKWLSPAKGLAVTNIDFPLKLAIKVENSQFAQKLMFFYQKQGEEEKNLIVTLSPVNSSDVTVLWAQPPSQTGTYNLWVKVYKWNGDSFNSSVLPIFISVPQTNTATSSPAE